MNVPLEPVLSLQDLEGQGWDSLKSSKTYPS
jgi:hypothetical protein